MTEADAFQDPAYWREMASWAETEKERDYYKAKAAELELL